MTNDPFDLVGARIRAAKEGDVEVARKLLIEFCASVRQNRRGGQLGAEPFARPVNGGPYQHTAFDERLLDYLVECFERIGDFEGEKKVSADVALNLATGGRGRPASKSTRAESLVRGQRVYELSHSTAEALSVEDAIQKVAVDEAKSPETTKKNYQEYLALLRAAEREIKESGSAAD